jgi:hypothetical protein
MIASLTRVPRYDSPAFARCTSIDTRAPIIAPSSSKACDAENPWAAPTPLEVQVKLTAFGNSDVEPIAL